MLVGSAGELFMLSGWEKSGFVNGDGCGWRTVRWPESL